jgi:signal transduction histidine kinase
MFSLRLSTKFLLSMLLISSALTITSLLFVRRSIQSQVRREILADLRNSVLTFQNVQRQRENTLSRSAELMADLPILRSLMTTPDAATIQDASQRVWQLGGSDLFVLADRAGRVVALHTSTPGFTRDSAQELLQHAILQRGTNHWWFGGGHLYEVFLQPIYFGSQAEDRLFGLLAVGYEINDQVTREASRVAGSQVAFSYGNTVARSTLSPSQEFELLGQLQKLSLGPKQDPNEVQLGDERFLATSVELAPGTLPPVRFSVLKSYDQGTAFLQQLNRPLLGLGLVAVLGGSILVFAISHTFTRPLSALVSGVRALEKGDYAYPLQAQGGDEVAEVTSAFSRMRESLQNTQRELLEAERLATIGRMASSISHDLRHSLAAIVANAEFLSETSLDNRQREELYQEVRVAVDQMTDMLESLLEFSRTSESVHPSFGSLQEPLEHAIQTARAHPEFSRIKVVVNCEGLCDGWFDFRRLERAFQNLLLNAFEAVSPEDGRVEVTLRQATEYIEIRVADNGRGIPAEIRDKLFHPFVSSGKQNGTGLGLTVVQKIVQDHGGEIKVENTSKKGTVFQIVLPLKSSPAGELASQGSAKTVAPLTHTEP